MRTAKFKSGEVATCPKKILRTALAWLFVLVALLISTSCDQMGPAKRSAAARLETIEAEKRIVMEKLSSHQAERDRLNREQAENEMEAQSVEQELQALLASNPLIMASLQGATSAFEEYQSSQTNQGEMDSGTILAGLLSGIYLAMNPDDTANVVAAFTDLDRRRKNCELRRASLARDLEEQEAQIRACEQQLVALTAESEPLITKAEAPAKNGYLPVVFAVLFAAAVAAALALSNRRSRISAPQNSRTERRPNSREEKRANKPPLLLEAGSMATLLMRGRDPEDPANPDISWRLRAGTEEKQIIGRKRGIVHLRIANSSVSKQHAAVWCHGRNFFIEDRNSSNGTRLNGRVLQPFTAQMLQSGDNVELGDIVLRVEIS